MIVSLEGRAREDAANPGGTANAIAPVPGLVQLHQGSTASVHTR
jgi:hypothetical protein